MTPTHPKRRHAVLLIVATVIALAVTGCGSDDGSSDARVAELEAAVEELQDERQIRDLYTAFSHSVDSDDSALLRTVVTEDIKADYSADFGFVLEGIDNFVAQTESGLGPPITEHLMATYDIDITGDTATGSRYVVAWHVDPDDPTNQFVVGARYDDILIRSADGWRISDFTFKVLFTDGDPTITQG